MGNSISANVRGDSDERSLQTRSKERPRFQSTLPGQDAVRRVLKARRARSKFFDAGLFADPAWDMLLELYAAECSQRKISVSSLCVASNVPATTALRWIRTLETRHLLRRVGDPHDGRRFFVSLTNKGFQAMAAYFQSVTPPSTV